MTEGVKLQQSQQRMQTDEDPMPLQLNETVLKQDVIPWAGVSSVIPDRRVSLQVHCLAAQKPMPRCHGRQATVHARLMA
jgi:hypothetical protein